MTHEYTCSAGRFTIEYVNAGGWRPDSEGKFGALCDGEDLGIYGPAPEDVLDRLLANPTLKTPKGLTLSSVRLPRTIAEWRYLR